MELMKGMATADKYGHYVDAILNATNQRQKEAAIAVAYIELRPLVEHIAMQSLHGKPRHSFFDITVDQALSKIFISLEEGKYNPKWAFSTWFKRIIVNTCIDMGRKFVNEPMCIHDEYKFTSPGNEPFYAERVKSFQQSRVETQMMERQVKKLVKSSLTGVKHKYKIAFMMFYLEGFSLKEVAKELKMEINATKTSIFRAKKTLRANLEAKGYSFLDLLSLPEQSTPQPTQRRPYNAAIRVSDLDAWDSIENPAPPQKVAA